MKNIRVIALDIDQTLTWEKDVISSRNMQAIRRAQEAGVFVTIATGRGFLSSKKIWQQLNIKGPTIQYGGAMIVHSPDGEPISVSGLPSDLVGEVLEFAHDLNIHAQIFEGDTVVAEKDCDFFTYYHNRTNLPYRIDSDLRKKTHTNIPKILAYTDPSIASEYREKIQNKFAGRVDVTISQPGFIEINGCGVSKGAALSRVSDILNIPRESIAALGDSTLDISMIEWAGCGVCVENGTPEAKAAADLIIPACRDDGVAYFSENYVL